MFGFGNAWSVLMQLALQRGLPSSASQAASWLAPYIATDADVAAEEAARAAQDQVLLDNPSAKGAPIQAVVAQVPTLAQQAQAKLDSGQPLTLAETIALGVAQQQAAGSAEPPDQIAADILSSMTQGGSNS